MANREKRLSVKELCKPKNQRKYRAELEEALKNSDDWRRIADAIIHSPTPIYKINCEFAVKIGRKNMESGERTLYEIAEMHRDKTWYSIPSGDMYAIVHTGYLTKLDFFTAKADNGLQYRKIFILGLEPIQQSNEQGKSNDAN